MRKRRNAAKPPRFIEAFRQENVSALRPENALKRYAQALLKVR